MKTHFFVQSVALLTVTATSAFGQQPSSRNRQVTTAAQEPQYEEQYVLVTGSNIPRKVKVRRYGTDTAENVKIYGERDIRASGRATTENALRALDPSISVIRH